MSSITNYFENNANKSCFKRHLFSVNESKQGRIKENRNTVTDPEGGVIENRVRGVSER